MNKYMVLMMAMLVTSSIAFAADVEDLNLSKEQLKARNQQRLQLKAQDGSGDAVKTKTQEKTKLQKKDSIVTKVQNRLRINKGLSEEARQAKIKAGECTNNGVRKGTGRGAGGEAKGKHSR